jgi:hypothetical protein
MPISPEAPAVLAPSKTIVEALVRMGRAVQKATIYPQGHPAIPGAVEHFLEVLPGALEGRPALSLGIAVDQFLIDGVPLDEKQGVISWLAQHLHERGLASITFAGTLQEAVVVSFVRWLAGSTESERERPDPPAFDGITMVRFDYARARFGEDPAEADGTERDAVRAWHAVMGGMAEGCGLETSGWTSDDPAEMAKEVNDLLQKQEGPGVRSIASRVIAMGATLSNVPEHLRAPLKRRLGAFIGSLTPALREQLLRVDPNSSRQKLEFVTELIDVLPKTTVIDVLGTLDKSGAHVPHQFITLMNKLIGVSAQDATLRREVGGKLETMGVPRALMDREPEKVKDVLTEVMQSRIEKTWNPESYQALLEELSARKVAGATTVTSSRYADPKDGEGNRAHVSEIALRLLVARPDAPEASDFVKCLEEDAPRAVGCGRFEQVHEAASTLRRMAGGVGELSQELQQQVQGYLSTFTREEQVRKIIAAAEEGEGLVPPAILGLFLLAGSEAVDAALKRLAEIQDGPEREPITQLLVAADPEAFTAAVGRKRGEGWAVLRVLFPVLHRIGGTRAVDLAMTFVGNEDARIRVDALRVLIACDSRPGQAFRYLERAVADESPRVVAFAVSQARQTGGSDMTYLLGTFLNTEARNANDYDLRVQTIWALAAFRTPEARDILINMLSRRKIALWVNDQRISDALEGALVQIGDAVSEAAVRRWRISPSRWISMLLVSGKVKDK